MEFGLIKNHFAENNLTIFVRSYPSNNLNFIVVFGIFHFLSLIIKIIFSLGIFYKTNNIF